MRSTGGGRGFGARIAAWMDANFSPSPDLGRGWRLPALAMGLWLATCAILVHRYGWRLGLGDTDDATRLTIVRDLVAGRGWFDQAVPRVVGPAPFFPHWSRLLDGGLAGVIHLLRGVMSPAWAEWATRYFWPMAWILPALGCALVVARNLGARSAVFVTAPLMMLHLALYRQFIPGRIDHHNIQIVMTMAALACVLARRDRTPWAAVGGAATGLGLAVGLEALMFHAVIGAGYALRLARDRREAGAAAAYGVTLGLSSATFFLVQTPPSRWGLPFCDALAVNLVVALATAGAGLAISAALARRASAGVRLLALGLTGGLAAAVYVGLEPACVHGPFATMDPRVRSFWFDHIQEVQTLRSMLRLAYPQAIVAIVQTAMTLTAGAYLIGRELPHPRSSTLIMGAALAIAAATASLTWRMLDYVEWVGLPALGAAFSYLSEKWLRDRMAPALTASIALSPAVFGGLTTLAINVVTPPPKAPTDWSRKCFVPAAFAPLSRLPRGVVMATQDLGPFILVTTSHSVIAAPYHRLAANILAVHEAFDAPPRLAEARVRALGADYVVTCPGYPMFVGPAGLGATVSRTPPAWLERLSAKGATLQIFRLRREGAEPSTPADAGVR